MRKPLAVVRRDYLVGTGPSIYGYKRMDRVASPEGEVFIFLGVKDGEVFLERYDKSKGEPFMKVDSSDFTRWRKSG